MMSIITSTSRMRGTFCKMTSSSVSRLAASAGKTAWLLPTAIIVPLIALAVSSIIDVYRVAKAKEKEEEEEIQAAMVEAGIDLNDEAAVEMFRQKEEFKREYRMKMDEELALAKKEYQQKLEEERKLELKKAKKERKESKQ